MITRKCYIVWGGGMDAAAGFRGAKAAWTLLLCALVLALALTSCGGKKDSGGGSPVSAPKASGGSGASSTSGANPKELAKQYYELSRQALDAAFDPEAAAKLAEKAEDIEQKVEKLSQSDQEIYAQELARLAGDNLEDLSGAAQEALNAAGGLLDSASKLSNDPAIKDAQKAAESGAAALEAAGGLLDTASKLSNDPSIKDAQKAAEAAQQANDMLKNLGY